MPELIGLTVEAARAALDGQTVRVTETVPPLGPKSPLMGATAGGAWRVIRARRAGDAWELLAAREQLRA